MQIELPANLYKLVFAIFAFNILSISDSLTSCKRKHSLGVSLRILYLLPSLSTRQPLSIFKFCSIT